MDSTLAAARKGDLPYFQNNIGTLDLNVRDDEGKTPLILASIRGHLDVVKFLVENGCNIILMDLNEYSAFTYAVQEKKIEIVKYFIQQNFGVEQSGTYIRPIILALMYNAFDIANLLLDLGAKVNVEDKRGLTPLMMAARFDNRIFTRILENEHVNVNAVSKDGHNALWDACESLNIKNCQALLSKGANANIVDKGGSSILMYLIENEYDDSKNLVKLLLEKGTNVNIVNNRGDNVLTLLSGLSVDNTDTMKLFIKNGVNINQINNRGEFALMKYAFFNDITECQICIDNGANINLVNSDGENALTMASQSSIETDVETIKWLVKNGIERDHMNNKGTNAIMNYTFNKNRGAVKELLLMGVDNKNAYGIAIREYNGAIVKRDIEKEKHDNDASREARHLKRAEIDVLETKQIKSEFEDYFRSLEPVRENSKNVDKEFNLINRSQPINLSTARTLGYPDTMGADYRKARDRHNTKRLQNGQNVRAIKKMRLTSKKRTTVRPRSLSLSLKNKRHAAPIRWTRSLSLPKRSKM